MSFDPTEYPIVLRVVKGYVVATQPDLEIVRSRGKFKDLKAREEIGAIVLDVWEEIVKRSKEDSPPPPSLARQAVSDSILQLLGTSEAAKAMGVSCSTIRKMCDRGDLQFITTAGGHRRIRITDPHLKFLTGR